MVHFKVSLEAIKALIILLSFPALSVAGQVNIIIALEINNNQQAIIDQLGQGRAIVSDIEISEPFI